MVKTNRREAVSTLLGGVAGLLGGLSIPTIGKKQATFPKDVEWEHIPYDFRGLEIWPPQVQECVLRKSFPTHPAIDHCEKCL